MKEVKESLQEAAKDMLDKAERADSSAKHHRQSATDQAEAAVIFRQMAAEYQRLANEQAQ